MEAVGWEEYRHGRLVRGRFEGSADIAQRARFVLQVPDKKRLGSSPRSDGWIQYPINLDSYL